MKPEIVGYALVLFEDFIKYAELDPDAMSEVMFYETDELIRRVKYLKRAMEKAKSR